MRRPILSGIDRSTYILRCTSTYFLMHTRRTHTRSSSQLIFISFFCIRIGTFRIYGAYRKIQYRFVFDAVPRGTVTSRKRGKCSVSFDFSSVFRVDRRDLK